MKIIHLSDTHIGRDDNARRADRLVQDILTLENPETCLVIHTGDLIDRASPHDMLIGRSLLDGLVAGGVRVLLCPGNHDYGDGAHIDPERAERFRECFAPFIFGDQHASFPVLTLIDDCAFIGLDSSSAEFSFLTRWMAEGCLGREQLRHLNELLDRTEVRERHIVLYLHHHPFLDAYAVRPDVADRHRLWHLFVWWTRRFRRLKDAYSLLQVIRDRVQLLLCGHLHFGLDYGSEARRYGIPLALDASSSTATDMDTDRMRYRVIDTQTGRVVTRFVPFSGFW